jgi:hypothetical protein
MLFGAIVGSLIGLALAVLVNARQSAQAPARQEDARRPPVTSGTWWPPSETQLMGTLAQAAAAVDPNMPVGVLLAAWLDHHQREGNIVVTVPERRQMSTDFQPPARGWRYGDPR